MRSPQRIETRDVARPPWTVPVAVATLLFTAQGCGLGQGESSAEDLGGEAVSESNLDQSVTISSTWAVSSGIYVTARYPGCPAKAAKIDLWYAVAGGYEYHGRCFANAGNAPSRPGEGFCYFKYPMPAGTPASSIIVRGWRPKADCSGYMDSVAPASASSYVDTRPSRNVEADPAYPAYPSRLTRLSGSSWSAAIDRNGGAIFEFASLRGTALLSGKRESAIHAHFGAGLQVAVHSGQPGSLTTRPCGQPGGQGYWNPTQAGAACTYSTSAGPSQSVAPGTGGLVLRCDGATNPSCSSASSLVEHSLFRMMNWDYGPGYTGPYEARDTLHIAQAVQAQPNYMTVDVTLKNTGGERTGAVEAPTFYFTNRFRDVRYSHLDGSGSSVAIPRNQSGIDSSNYRLNVDGRELAWISFKNEDGHVYTLASFPGPAMKSDTVGRHWTIQEGDLYDNLKFTNVPVVKLRTNTEYKFRYVVFPFGPDETVSTPFGSMSTSAAIAALRSQYAGGQAPAPAPTPTPGEMPSYTGSSTRLFHQLGRAEGTSWSATVHDGRGYLSYGPYATDWPSTAASVSFELAVDNNTADDAQVAYLDVFDSTTGTVLAGRSLTRRQMAAPMTARAFSLGISMAGRVGHRMEARVYVPGTSYVRLHRIALSAQASAPPPTGSTLVGGTVTSNDVLAGWEASRAIDGNAGTIYSSNQFSSSSNSRGTFIAAWPKAPLSVRSVRLTARVVNGVPLGFPAQYHVALTKPDNSAWEIVGTYTTQPSNGIVEIDVRQSGGAARYTYGLQIIPVQIGRDDGGRYYFQLAELDLRP